MGKRKIVEAVDRQERIKRRKTLGRLHDLIIQPSTEARYQKAFKGFLSFLAFQRQTLAKEKSGIDLQVSHYIETLWDEGESISSAGDTLSSLQHYQPSLKRHLSNGWRLLKAWQQHELPARAPPFTVETLQVLLGWLHQKSPPVSLAVFLAFRCLLRTGEMMSVTAQDLIIPANSLSGVLYLGDTKTSKRNPHAGCVNLTDPSLVLLLKAWKQSVSPTTSLVPWSSSKFRAVFQEGLKQTKLEQFKFKPYSLRRGGATDQWLLTKNYAHVSHLGRWSSERTLKIYIQDSIALLTSLQFKPSPTQRSWINLWNSKCRVEPMTRGHKGGGRGRRNLGED